MTSSPARSAWLIASRQAGGSLPPAGAMPRIRVVGRCGSASASSSVATIGMSVWPPDAIGPITSPTVWPAWSESRIATTGSVP